MYLRRTPEFSSLSPPYRTGGTRVLSWGLRVRGCIELARQGWMASGALLGLEAVVLVHNGQGRREARASRSWRSHYDILVKRHGWT